MTDSEVRELRRLINTTIVGVTRDADGYLHIVLEDEDIEHDLVLFSDEEGNGPGSFDLRSYNAFYEDDPYPIPL